MRSSVTNRRVSSSVDQTTCRTPVAYAAAMTTVAVTHHQMFIDGRGVDSEESYELRSPATGASGASPLERPSLPGSVIPVSAPFASLEEPSAIVR